MSLTHSFGYLRSETVTESEWKSEEQLFEELTRFYILVGSQC